MAPGSEPLVSIIIPTFNRAHLIGETLESIRAQTYQNWECIVVDDGSTDNTDEVLKTYLREDTRFQYYHRPADRPKGANACRNYGFEISKGEYIQWFDSDDLMMPDNIASKIEAFRDQIDIVIGNSINLDINGKTSRPYQLNYDVPITAENFIGQKIGWITNDALVRKTCVTIRFNEKLLSGQEYNFFSRLLYVVNKVVYVKKDLARRRIHPSSIQGELYGSKRRRTEELFFNEKQLLEDIHECASEQIIIRSLKRLIRFSYTISDPYSPSKRSEEVLELLRKNKKYSSYFFYKCWIVSNLTFGKGYFLVKLAGKKL